MKKLLLLIVVIIFTGSYLYAQVSEGSPGTYRSMERAANIGHVFGKLTDADGKPLNGASVMMMLRKMDTATKKVKEVLVKGMITKSSGDFNFDELPVMGSLQLKISSSGYKALEQEISFLPKKEAGSTPSSTGGLPSFEKDMGNIKLSQDSKQLQDITVAISSPAVRLSADKKIFNVEKNLYQGPMI